MDWMIPNYDPQILYTIKEISRWTADNVLTLLIIGNILQWLKKKAIQTPSVVDDKIISLLINFFSFQWTKEMLLKKKNGNGEKPPTT